MSTGAPKSSSFAMMIIQKEKQKHSKAKKTSKRTFKESSSGSEGETDHYSDSNTDTEETAGGSLATIMAKILRTNTQATPILSKRKAVERKLEEEQLDRRARTILRREMREQRDAAHQPPAVDNREKLLRKQATRGVVQLFNAVHQHQVVREKAEREAKAAKEAKIANRLEAIKTNANTFTDAPAHQLLKDVKSLSKASFLQLLKMGGGKNKVE